VGIIAAYSTEKNPVGGNLGLVRTTSGITF
jgi:hypothetical protein